MGPDAMTFVFWMLSFKPTFHSPLSLSLRGFLDYIMLNVGLDEAQAGIKIAGRNINNLMYANDTTFMGESKEELKCFWWKWKKLVKMLA